MVAARSRITLAPPGSALSLTWPEPARVAPLALAYSGGLDSTVLLHLLCAAAQGRLRALHIHHGLQAAADDWAAHCVEIGRTLGVEVEVLRVQVCKDGRGPEAAARDARYRALRAALSADEVLVTAQHLHDQAETLLLNLFRGSGLRGLAGMQQWSAFAPGFLWRPLLQTPRPQLRAHAVGHDLRWIEDPHNDDPRFSRSRLRTRLWPLLESHWPNLAQMLGRSADNLAEAGAVLDEVMAADVQALRVPEDRAALSVSALRALSPARRHLALRAWIAGQTLPAPFRDSLCRIDTELLDAAADRAPRVAWPGAEVRRYRDRVYAMAPLPAAVDFDLCWDGNATLALPAGAGWLRPGVGPAVAGRVRRPRPGERFRPQGAARASRLKALYQARGVPTWIRERAPLLERDGEAIWIGGLGLAQGREEASPLWACGLPGWG